VKVVPGTISSQAQRGAWPPEEATSALQRHTTPDYFRRDATNFVSL
jgi:hypothetical protein